MSGDNAYIYCLIHISPARRADTDASITIKVFCNKINLKEGLFMISCDIFPTMMM